MNVHVRYFAGAREAAGREGESLEVRAGSDIHALMAELLRLHPALGSVAPSLRYAVGETFASPEAPLEEGAVVALIPPVGGG